MIALCLEDASRREDERRQREMELRRQVASRLGTAVAVHAPDFWGLLWHDGGLTPQQRQDAMQDWGRVYAELKENERASLPADAAILGASPDLHVPLIMVGVRELLRLERLSNKRGHWRDELSLADALGRVLKPLLGRRQPYTADDLRGLVDLLAAEPGTWRWWSENLALLDLLSAIRRAMPQEGFPSETRAALARLRASARGEGNKGELNLIDEMLDAGQGATAIVQAADRWGVAARADLAAMSVDLRERWAGLLAHARSATTARPTKPWLAAAARQIDALGEATFDEVAARWLDLFSRPSPPTDGASLPLVPTERNATLLRGLIWSCSRRGDERIARAVGDAAEAAFKKLAEIGARSTKVGNAAVWCLGALPGTHGLVQLQRLVQCVKQPSARETVERTLSEAASRAGISRYHLEDVAVPTFDLVDGRLRWGIGAYTAEVAVIGPSRVELRWYDVDGSPRRSEPAQVRRAHPEERAALRRTVKGLQGALIAQRNRVEQCILTQRSWSLSAWREHYLDHPLVSLIARRLIWHFEGDARSGTGAWLDGRVVDAEDRPLTWLTDATRVRLWHPLITPAGEALAWRLWVERHELRQPFKQAHREVYVLTDAERQTETYSNRFAAHILRHHQFKALCDAQGWRYSLGAGWYGRGCATGALPDEMYAEFWVEPTSDTGEQLSRAGVALYAITDQVRFHRARDGRPMALAEVPPLLFSEAMRDVDLFVGVASAGNDPTWQDHGPEQYRAYWQDYAFGELSASAATRRAVLERLLPRLAIADRCELSDKFLIVRGDLRTYKIHLGSGNILMEPGSQYLCIVPGRDRDAANGDLFLPFDGDAMLSVILSKTFLLAADASITDPTITRQIAGR